MRSTRRSSRQGARPASQRSTHFSSCQAVRNPGSSSPSALLIAHHPWSHLQSVRMCTDKRCRDAGEQACRVLSPGATHASLVFAQHNNAMLQQIPSSMSARGARVLLTLPNPCKFELRRATDYCACSRISRSR